MLIRTIEANNLNLFDKGKQPAQARTDIQMQNTESIPGNVAVTNNTPASSSMRVPERVQRVMENNRIQYIIVRDGETKEAIEQEFQLLKWELVKYNELSAEFVPVQGQILYLQPKRDRAEPGKEYYVAGNGDTMYSISQKFGVKIKKLYEYNRMGDGSEPVAGDKIYLRDLKPAM
jgi:LysM repeat protein